MGRDVLLPGVKLGLSGLERVGDRPRRLSRYAEFNLSKFLLCKTQRNVRKRAEERDILFETVSLAERP